MPQKARDIIPLLIVKTSQGHVQNDGITYNQAGVSFNDLRYSYGGFYGFADVIPLISLIKDPQPSLFIKDTLQQLNNPGITYNQSGVSYNDTRYTYGGVYGYDDIIPIISQARNPGPIIINYADIYTLGTLPINNSSGYLIGILGLTYP